MNSVMLALNSDGSRLVTLDATTTAGPGELLDPRHLNRLAEERHDGYVGNLPFPHIVIDNFLPPGVLATIIAEFPGPNAIAWKLHRHRHSDKLACGDDLLMGPMTRRLLRELNSGYFLQFLERLTGIDGLISDPLLNGGGLHQILPGGHLGIHADFNFHPQWHLDRRLNLLIYLNENWEDGFGGHLELWNSDMSQCVDKILPIASRCVIFNTSDTSFHGHPLPLSCPEGMSRRSLALYYYTNGRPQSEVSREHSTIYKDRVSATTLAMAFTSPLTSIVAGLRKILKK